MSRRSSWRVADTRLVTLPSGAHRRLPHTPPGPTLLRARRQLLVHKHEPDRHPLSTATSTVQCRGSPSAAVPVNRPETRPGGPELLPHAETRPPPARAPPWAWLSAGNPTRSRGGGEEEEAQPWLDRRTEAARGARRCARHHPGRRPHLRRRLAGGRDAFR